MVLGLCTPWVGCAAAFKEVKRLNRDVQEKTYSGRAGISRATMEAVRVQLYEQPLILEWE